MCSPSTDCKFCGHYVEVCPRVKRAFPLPEDETTAGRPRRPQGQGKTCIVCGGGPVVPHKARCAEHQALYYREHYAKNAEAINEKKRMAYHARRVNSE